MIGRRLRRLSRRNFVILITILRETLRPERYAGQKVNEAMQYNRVP